VKKHSTMFLAAVMLSLGIPPQSRKPQHSRRLGSVAKATPAVTCRSKLCHSRTIEQLPGIGDAYSKKIIAAPLRQKDRLVAGKSFPKPPTTKSRQSNSQAIKVTAI